MSKQIQLSPPDDAAYDGNGRKFLLNLLNSVWNAVRARSTMGEVAATPGLRSPL